MKRIARTSTAKKQTLNDIIRKIFTGLGYSVLISLILSAVFAVVFLNSNFVVHEFMSLYTNYLIFGISLVSIFFSTIIIIRNNHTKSLLIGVSIGAFYIIFTSIVGYQVFHGSFVLLIFVNKLLAGVVAGALGSLVGVNL